MTKRERDLHRLLQHIADQANARLLQIRCTGSGHQRATFARNDGNTVHLIAASTTGCNRSHRNLAAFARRQLRA